MGPLHCPVTNVHVPYTVTPAGPHMESKSDRILGISYVTVQNEKCLQFSTDPDNILAHRQSWPRLGI